MKRILKLSIPFFVALAISPSTNAVVILPKTIEKNLQPPFTTHPLPGGQAGLPGGQAGLPTGQAGSPFTGLTIKDFLTLTPKKYKELTGNKLSLPQKLSLKFAQFKVKKMIKKNRKIDLLLVGRDIDTNNFDILGFILGLALGPLGVLIAYLLEGKSSSTFTWAVIGGLIWLGVFLLVILVL